MWKVKYCRNLCLESVDPVKSKVRQIPTTSLGVLELYRKQYSRMNTACLEQKYRMVKSGLDKTFRKEWYWCRN